MSERRAYARVFVEALGRELDSMATLDELLAAALAESRRIWPTIEVPAEDFVRHLAAHLGDGDRDALERLHASDLYLTAGCLLGFPTALQAFEATFLPEIRAVARRVSKSVDAEELAQNLRESLFVGREGRPARIVEYSGRGPLGAWLRVVVTRAALNAATRAPKEQPAEDDDRELLDAAGQGSDPELHYFRSHYEAEVTAVFPAALEALSLRERLYLRQRFVDRLTLEQMSRMHGVHIATVKRTLASARDTLSEALRARLTERLGLSPSEFESVLALIRSRFHITMQRLLPSEE